MAGWPVGVPDVERGRIRTQHLTKLGGLVYLWAAVLCTSFLSGTDLSNHIHLSAALLSIWGINSPCLELYYSKP